MEYKQTFGKLLLKLSWILSTCRWMMGKPNLFFLYETSTSISKETRMKIPFWWFSLLNTLRLGIILPAHPLACASSLPGSDSLIIVVFVRNCLRCFVALDLLSAIGPAGRSRWWARESSASYWGSQGPHIFVLLRVFPVVQKQHSHWDRTGVCLAAFYKFIFGPSFLAAHLVQAIQRKAHTTQSLPLMLFLILLVWVISPSPGLW